MIRAVNVGEGFAGVSLSTVVSDAELMFLTGHCPTDADGEVVEGDFETQVTAVFDNLQRTLAVAGVGFEAVAKLNVFVTEMNAEVLATVKKVRSKYVNLATPPASTFITVTALYDPAIKIEIDGIAAIPRSK